MTTERVPSKGVSKAWLNALLELAKNGNANICCPNCGQANLTVTDMPSDIKVIERLVRCKACGKEDIMLNRAGWATAAPGNE